MLGVAAITALLVTVGPGTSLWWVCALMQHHRRLPKLLA
jgi:hypothetical protein